MTENKFIVASRRSGKSEKMWQITLELIRENPEMQVAVYAQEKPNIPSELEKNVKWLPVRDPQTKTSFEVTPFAADDWIGEDWRSFIATKDWYSKRESLIDLFCLFREFFNSPRLEEIGVLEEEVDRFSVAFDDWIVSFHLDLAFANRILIQTRIFGSDYVSANYQFKCKNGQLVFKIIVFNEWTLSTEFKEILTLENTKDVLQKQLGNLFVPPTTIRRMSEMEKQLQNTPIFIDEAHFISDDLLKESIQEVD